VSSFKTLVVMCTLAGAGYWMYINMWQKPETPPANAQAIINPPSVQIPGLASPGLQSPGATQASPANVSPTLLGSGSAPPFSANTASIPGPSGSAPGSPSMGDSAPATADGVAMLNPPGATNTSNVRQDDISTGTSPSLLSASPAGQTPAAIYPSPGASTSPPAASLSDSSFQAKFDTLMQDVSKKLDEGRLAEVQLVLSSLYDNPDLPPAQARQVTDLLDKLAGTVIYSRQHYLEQPYVVRQGDTLDQIARQYNVPVVLLARINGIRDPQNLETGRELKVVRGPFNAVVHLDKHELTLMVEGRYAGRFPIGVGCDQPKLEGEYVVRDKNLNPAYRGPDGATVPGGDPHNPLGKFWIGLSDSVGLHGTVDPQNIGRDDNRGAICLGDRDIDDIYGILSIGSRVVIQR
jgi:hypothetical protein